jgi:hypothetical protein
MAGLYENTRSVIQAAKKGHSSTFNIEAWKCKADRIFNEKVRLIEGILSSKTKISNK